MAWPLNNPHNSHSGGHGGGYKKVSTGDYFDAPRSGSGGGGGNSGNEKFSSGGGGQRGSSALHAQMELRRAEQNDELSILDGGVTRLGELSLGISREIDMQNRMIDNLQEDTERVQTQAEMLTKQTQELMKKSGGPRTFCFIVVLVVIFAFLTLLVLYT